MFYAVTLFIVTAQLVQIEFGEQIKFIIESLDKKKFKKTKLGNGICFAIVYSY